MAQVEKIKALIREMMDQEMENYKDAVSLGTQDETSAPVVYTMLQVLLTKIEKMPNEPANDDFEKEVYEHLWKGRMGADVSKPIYFSYDELLEVARHFAAWQKQKDADAINENALLYSARLEGIDIGKAEMKQQLMKDAIETSVCAMLDGIHIDILPNQLKGYRFGDKVKVIIIKED